jgi:hypothetical protein
MIPALLTSSLLGFLPPPPLEAPVAADPISAFLLPSPMDPVLVPDPQGAPSPTKRSRWQTGRTVMQGFLGVTFFDEYEVDGSNNFVEIDGGGEDASEMPLIGGGGQMKLGGENIDMGLELLVSFGWRSNATAIAVGGGGAAIAVDVDTLLFDLYGGPFVSKFLGEKVRIYGSAGPLMEWADYDQEFAGGHESGSGFGFGWYARTGIEFQLASRTMIGVGARWSDSTIDLDGGLGDLDVQGFQGYITVTQGF